MDLLILWFIKKQVKFTFTVLEAFRYLYLTQLSMTRLFPLTVLPVLKLMYYRILFYDFFSMSVRDFFLNISAHLVACLEVDRNTFNVHFIV